MPSGHRPRPPNVLRAAAAPPPRGAAVGPRDPRKPGRDAEAHPWGWIDPDSLPRPQGPPRCSAAGAVDSSLPPDDLRSAACVHEHRLRTSTTCAAAIRGTEGCARRRLGHQGTGYESARCRSTEGGRRGGGSSPRRRPEGPRTPQAGRRLWDADHKLAVWQRGGMSKLDMQTLCIPCHRRKTDQQATERAEQRRAPTQAPEPPLSSDPTGRSGAHRAREAHPASTTPHTPHTPWQPRLMLKSTTTALVVPQATTCFRRTLLPRVAVAQQPSP